jgi:predicted transcriptional regulator
MLTDDTHEKMAAKWMQDPAIRAEVERLEREETPMFDAILKARKEAGLTQAQVAERMGTKAPAIARLENALVPGSPSPSLATLRKYAAALGKTLEIRLA